MTNEERIERLTELVELLHRMDPSFARRIAKYATVEEDGCFGWCGPVSGHWKRPHLHHGASYVKVARLVLEAQRGRPLGKLFACHTCDNARCIRPSHLFAGTNSTNMLDMVAKGRHSSRLSPHSVLKGERAPSARLTAAQVETIRRLAESGLTHSELGRRYGVSQQQVTRIVHRQVWRSVG